MKGLLATRNPVAGIARSTGNRRMMGVPLPSNLVVATSRGMSDEEMAEEFRLLIEERGNDYGVVVRRLANPMAKLDRADVARTPRGEVAVDRLTRAYRVYPDGREEVIRKAELSGLSESDFRDIVATSATTTNYTLGFVPTIALQPRGHHRGPTIGAAGLATARCRSRPLSGTSLFEGVERGTLRSTARRGPRAATARGEHPFFDSQTRTCGRCLASGPHAAGIRGSGGAMLTAGAALAFGDDIPSRTATWTLADSLAILDDKMNEALDRVAASWTRGEDEWAFITAVYRDVGGLHWIDKLEKRCEGPMQRGRPRSRRDRPKLSDGWQTPSRIACSR